MSVPMHEMSTAEDSLRITNESQQQNREDVQRPHQQQERQVSDGDSASQRKMSRAEAGRKGGLSTKKRYGDGYFSEIGRLGGKKGGETTKRRYGVEFYQEIGRKGGSR